MSRKGKGLLSRLATESVAREYAKKYEGNCFICPMSNCSNCSTIGNKIKKNECISAFRNYLLECAN